MTIDGQAFPHLIYHFVLSYSNWETGSICYSETFESLSEGLQNALWELGGVPREHRTDRMSAAVNNMCDAKEFTRAYEGLLRHYGVVAPLIGKQPPDFHIWILGGPSPAFIREEGQLYEGGPIWRIEQISPAFTQ